MNAAWCRLTGLKGVSMKSKLILMTAVALAMGGCNRHDADTQSQYTHLTGTETALITQPVVPDRGPVAPNANTAAPGTDASVAFAAPPSEGSVKAPRGDGVPSEHADVAAQDAAAQAPDTATADEEKRRVQEEFASGQAAPPVTAAPPPATMAAAPASATPAHDEESRQQ
jgi:hypothetical protein